MILRKSNFVNILFILSSFYHINSTKALEVKSENNYLFEKNMMIVVEAKIPKSRLLTNKNSKKNRVGKEQVKKKNKEKNETKKNKNFNIIIKKEDKVKKKKIENKLIKITINYLPYEEKPDISEFNALEKFITKFSNLNSLTIQGYAEKREGDSSSKARRLSLKRALFLRELFLKNSFKSTKIYVKAMGHDINIIGSKDIVIISAK